MTCGRAATWGILGSLLSGGCGNDLVVVGHHFDDYEGESVHIEVADLELNETLVLAVADVESGGFRTRVGLPPDSEESLALSVQLITGEDCGPGLTQEVGGFGRVRIDGRDLSETVCIGEPIPTTGY